MEFCAERGLVCAGWGDVTRGADEDTTRCRPNVGRGSRSQTTSSVNSPAGNVYGSTSMDCHYALCLRAHRVVRLYRVAFAAAGARCRRTVTGCHGE